MSLSLSSFLKKREINLAVTLLYLGGGVVSFGFYRLIQRYILWLFSPLKKLPGPAGNRSFFLGVFPEINNEPFMQPHKRWIAEAGPDAKLIYYTTVFGRQNLLVVDKEITKQILTAPAGKNNNRFKKLIVAVQNVVGDGLVTLDGEAWMRHRRIIQPAFSTSLLRNALQSTVPTKVNELIGYWKTAVHREIDVSSHLSALTLDIIGPVAFSHPCHGLEAIQSWATKMNTRPDKDSHDDKPEIDDPFLTSLSMAFKFDLLTVALYTLHFYSLDGLRYSKRRARRFLNRETDKIVSQAATSQSKTKSVLSALLEAQQDDNNGGESPGRLTFEELRDEVKMFMLAGHETTSTWCYWVLYALAKHPNLQERLYRNVVAYAPLSFEDIGVEQVGKMEYLGAFLQEVLRLYPPAGYIPRVNRFNETLGGVQVPAGTRIGLSPHLLHRHPKYWDDPEEFQPERWINVSEKEVERRRFAFFPFGFGGRNCIGQFFATLEAQMIVAATVRSFRVEIAPSQKETDFAFSSRITMKSKPLLRLTVHERPAERLEI